MHPGWPITPVQKRLVATPFIFEVIQVERETVMTKMFLNTLKAPYYDRMIWNSNKDFSDMVSTGEMIENEVKLKR